MDAQLIISQPYIEIKQFGDMLIGYILTLKLCKY